MTAKPPGEEPPLPTTCRPEDARHGATWQALAKIGSEDGLKIPLCETALLISKARRPSLKIEPHLRLIDGWCDEVRDFLDGIEPSLENRLRALKRTLFSRHGFGGGEGVFDDLDAADLAHVIETRRGLPVALGIICLEIAERLGWPMVGIDFPGRFLLRLDPDVGPNGDGWQEQRRIVDVFTGLAELPVPELRGLLKAIEGADRELTPAHFQEMGKRRVLLRLQQNIRARELERGRPEAALRTLEIMLAIAPKVWQLWRDAGLLRARLGQVRDAIAALELSLELAPETEAAESGYHISLMLQDLRSRLN